MILQTQEEKDAFEFVIGYALERTNRICNDLPSEWEEKFKNITVTSSDVDGTTFDRKVLFDFDVIHWLKEQAK